MHSDFALGMTDRGLLYWPKHSGETWLSKQEEAEAITSDVREIFANLNEVLSEMPVRISLENPSWLLSGYVEIT
jgi:hypothetical protein